MNHKLNCFVVCVVLLFFCATTLAQEFVEITDLGKPIRDIQAAKDQWKYFKINVQTTLQNMQDTDTLSVLVTPYSGDADLYIDANNFPTTDCTTCWRSTSPHGDIISLQKTDEKWPRGTPASLFIGVYARSISMFTVNTWLTGTHVQLDDGEPQTAKALARQYTYFDYVLNDASNITIAVTPISGDPDIYASVEYFEPNTTSYTWHSRDWGYDLVHIRSRDPRYVPGSPENPVTYHVGVYAFTDTYFTMSINKDTSYTTLVEGVPLTNNVDRLKYQYFKFYLASPKNLILNVNPLTSRGDPDIYVNFGEAEPRPSREQSRWRSLGSGVDTLTIRDAAAGWYYIAIYGYTFTNFQLTATVENKNVLLYDGIKQYSFVEQGAYTYYKYYHGDADSGLNLAVMPTGASLMDVFVSRTNPNPTGEEGKFDFRAFHVGQQSIVSLPTPVRVGNYYIGVYGRTSGNFSIVAATNQSHTLLREGDVSFWNSVPKGYYRYFVYDIHNWMRDQDITITVNPWRGEVDLYVDPFVAFPKEGNATFISRYWRQDTIVIHGSDPRLGNSRRLFIGVHGYSDAYFSITAFLSNTTLEIKDGFSVPGATEAGKSRYYKFYMPNPGSLTINLELADSGNTEANLYASTRSEKPSSLDNQWASTNFGSDVINIDYLASGWIYLAAHGVMGQRIRYVITARVNHQVLTVNRVSMLSYNAFNTTSNYQAFVWQDCDYLLAAVSLISGRTNLYISSNGTASKDRSQWKSTTWPGNAILITKNDPNWGRYGYWNLQVEALANSDYYISLVCASNQPGFTYGANLAEGVARLGIAPAQGFILYMFRVNYDWNTQKVTDDYSIYIRSIKSPVNVYAHQDFRIPPGPRNYTFHSVGSGDRIMTIKKESLSFGYLYIALYGVNADAYYEITVAKAQSPRYLLQEQPQSVAAEAGASNYFRMLSARGASNVYAYVESCDNSAPPTLYADLQNQYPSEGNAQFKSAKQDDYLQQLYIQMKVDPSGIETPRQVYLGVKNTTPNKQIYSVFVSNDKEDSRPIVPKSLMYGAPFNGNQFTLKFAKAQNPEKFAGRTLTYTVFKHHAEIIDGKPVPVNFDTPCGVKINGGRGDGIATNFNPIDNTFDYVMNYEPGRVYRVNVIVTDDLGLAAAYEPVWVIDGRVYNAWPGIFLFHVSIGFVFLLVVFLLFTAYFSFGSLVNVIRGKRGLQVVPNVDFWRELPFIVLDGIKFLVTCGKATESYSNFEDEAPTVNTSGFEHAPASEEKKEEPKAQPQSSSSGYGAI